MCDFPSWYEDEEGNIIFLTDKDARDHDIDFYNAVGHSAILEVFKRSRAGLKAGESFPCPSKIALEIQRGNMANLAKAAGFQRGVGVDSDGQYIEKGYPLGKLFFEIACEQIKSPCSWLDLVGYPTMNHFSYQKIAEKFMEKSKETTQKTPGMLLYEIHKEVNGNAISYETNKEKYQNIARVFLERAKVCG